MNSAFFPAPLKLWVFKTIMSLQDRVSTAVQLKREHNLSSVSCVMEGRQIQAVLLKQDIIFYQNCWTFSECRTHSHSNVNANCFSRPNTNNLLASTILNSLCLSSPALAEVIENWLHLNSCFYKWLRKLVNVLRPLEHHLFLPKGSSQQFLPKFKVSKYLPPLTSKKTQVTWCVFGCVWWGFGSLLW